MKGLKRVFCVVFVLVLLFPGCPPSAAQAASKITLKSGAAAPSTVYTEKSYALKVAGGKVKFYSSNKKVATVGISTGKLKPIAPGTVRISAKSVKTGRTVATKSFTVLQRATSIALDPGVVYLNKGDTKTVKAIKTPSTSTDVIKYFSSDKTVVTVGMTSGKITAVADGKATVTAYAMATTAISKTSKYNKIATMEVFVGPHINQVQQVALNTLLVTFANPNGKLKSADFSITNNSTNESVAVLSASAETDSVAVTLVAAADMMNASYTVRYGNTSYTFTATNNLPASIAMDTTTITTGVSTALSASIRDANGVVLRTYASDQTDEPLFEFIIRSGNGSVENGKLTLPDIDATAIASCTLHTYQFENGTEVGTLSTGDIIISAEKPKEFDGDWSYTVSPGNSSSGQPSGVGVVVGDTPSGLLVLGKDNNIKNAEAKTPLDVGFTVASSDESVAAITLLEDGSYAITAKKAGTVYVILKNDDHRIINAFPIKVQSERRLSRISMDPHRITLGTNGSATVCAVAYDQYGDIFDIGKNGASAECRVDTNFLGAPSATDPIANPSSEAGVSATITAWENIIKATIQANGAPVNGSYTYVLTVRQGANILTQKCVIYIDEGIQSHTLRFVDSFDNRELYDSIKVRAGQSFFCPVPSVTHKDLAFSHWVLTTADGQETGVITPPSMTSTMLESDMTAIAVWRSTLAFTITFDTDGGKQYPPEKRNFGDSLSDIAARFPTKTGHSFLGWYVDGKPMPSIMPERDITIKAKWEMKTQETEAPPDEKPYYQ